MDEVEVAEWEEVQTPSPISDCDTIIVGDSYTEGNLNVFPPNNHEGLQISPPNDQLYSSDSSSSSLSSHVVEDRTGKDNGSNLRSRFEALKTGIAWLAGRFGLCWSFGVSVAGGVVVQWLLYWRLRRRSEKKDQVSQLLLLLKEREHKISELLIQIAQVNQLLSARHNVPVIRVY